MKRFPQLFVFLLVCSYVTAQQTKDVDFKRVAATIFIDQFEIGSIFGTPYKIEFQVINSVDSIFINAVDMKFDSVRLNNEDVDFINTGKEVVVLNNFKKGRDYQLQFNFYASPKKAMYFFENNDKKLDQLWTQGQGMYTSHWLPSIDDVNDKIEFDLTFNTPKDYEVISNGRQVDSIVGLFGNWFFDMKKPISSYLVALAIGKYKKKTEVSKSGIPLEYYYYPEDSLKIEPTYRYTKEMFDFFEEEIGVPYPWQNYKQVPVKDFLYSGMENVGLTIFSDSFMVDSIAFNDKNYITVNAHELAHQWFGNMVTAKSDKHHWLQEGFATYYALLAEQALYGENHYYWQLFENAQELIAQEESGHSTSLLDPKSSSTTFYKKGAWALHVLRKQIGDLAFRSAVKSYLEKYQFANVETSDFIAEAERTSGQDLSDFVKVWLEGVSLPEDAMVKSLKQSSFMQEYFMVDCDVYTSKCKDYVSSYVSDKAKMKVVSQIPDKIDANAFQNSLEVRQAIAKHMEYIPEALKLHYESLLDDQSYVTIENALYHLWVNFPQNRIEYLHKTKDIIGFNDYNVRLLWLALHLNTMEYQSKLKNKVLGELISYSLKHYHFELRINAFNYLKLLDAFEEKSLESLLAATKHHNWRFSKYAKALVLELEQKEVYKRIIETLKNKQK
ncbi:M1 family metallopeptidase [Psychroserpens sp. MEBiC05023]